MLESVDDLSPGCGSQDVFFDISQALGDHEGGRPDHMERVVESK